MNERRTTNMLLLILVIPVIIYILKTFSFIFIPLVGSMFAALLFLPLTRWLRKKGIPQALNITIVCLVLIGIIGIAVELFSLSSREILSTKDAFVAKAEVKLVDFITTVEKYFGMERDEEETIVNTYFKSENPLQEFGKSFGVVTRTISMFLSGLFFLVLLLADSVDLQKALNNIVVKQRFASIKVFRKIEKDIYKFVIVKTVLSFLTGVGFTLACIAFDVSFPIFWGLFAFLINYVQMIGSIVSVILCSLFAIVELDPTGTLLVFVLILIGVQVLFGAILEPIFMGKTFSINVVSILVMLMLWGYIWGIPGMIMSIPITVFLKIILDQFPKTRKIAELLEGNTVQLVHLKNESK